MLTAAAPDQYEKLGKVELPSSPAVVSAVVICVDVSLSVNPVEPAVVAVSTQGLAEVPEPVIEAAAMLEFGVAPEAHRHVESLPPVFWIAFRRFVRCVVALLLVLIRHVPAAGAPSVVSFAKR